MSEDKEKKYHLKAADISLETAKSNFLKSYPKYEDMNFVHRIISDVSYLSFTALEKIFLKFIQEIPCGVYQLKEDFSVKISFSEKEINNNFLGDIEVKNGEFLRIIEINDKDKSFVYLFELNEEYTLPILIEKEKNRHLRKFKFHKRQNEPVTDSELEMLIEKWKELGYQDVQSNYKLSKKINRLKIYKQEELKIEEIIHSYLNNKWSSEMVFDMSYYDREVISPDVIRTVLDCFDFSSSIVEMIKYFYHDQIDVLDKEYKDFFENTQFLDFDVSKEYSTGEQLSIKIASLLKLGNMSDYKDFIYNLDVYIFKLRFDKHINQALEDVEGLRNENYFDINPYSYNDLDCEAYTEEDKNIINIIDHQVSDDIFKLNIENKDNYFVYKNDKLIFSVVEGQIQESFLYTERTIKDLNCIILNIECIKASLEEEASYKM